MKCQMKEITISLYLEERNLLLRIIFGAGIVLKELWSLTDNFFLFLKTSLYNIHLSLIEASDDNGM